MRHRKRKGKLNRSTSHRIATLSMMAKHLIMYQGIRTTHAKAKEARRLAERLITLAKKNDLTARRRAFSILKDRDVVVRLFKDIMPLFANRVGGYTRIIPIRTRRGDGAELVLLELTEKIKEEKPEKKHKAKEKKTEPKESKTVERKPEDSKGMPEISQEEKEERIVEEVKKDRARKEEKRVEKKGFFKKFFRRRTNM